MLFSDVCVTPIKQHLTEIESRVHLVSVCSDAQILIADQMSSGEQIQSKCNKVEILVEYFQKHDLGILPKHQKKHL